MTQGRAPAAASGRASVRSPPGPPRRRPPTPTIVAEADLWREAAVETARLVPTDEELRWLSILVNSHGGGAPRTRRLLPVGAPPNVRREYAPGGPLSASIGADSEFFREG